MIFELNLYKRQPSKLALNLIYIPWIFERDLSLHTHVFACIIWLKLKNAKNSKVTTLFFYKPNFQPFASL
jgi:hypothetical protein